MCLRLKVFLEVISTEFVVQAQLIIELFYVQMVCFPKFGSCFCRNELYLFPSSLQRFHFFITLVGSFGVGTQLLDALDDFLLLAQIFLLELLLFFCQLGTHFFDQTHLCLKFFFKRVGFGLEFLGSTTGSDECLTSSHHLGIVKPIVCLFQLFQLCSLCLVGFVHQFLEAIDNLLLGLRLRLGRSLFGNLSRHFRKCFRGFNSLCIFL